MEARVSERNEWFFAKGAVSRDGWESVVDGTLPGWTHTGIRVADLAAGDERLLDDPAVERLFVPLSGSFSVRYTTAESDSGSAGERITDLEGRTSVFDGPTDVLYLPVGTRAILSGTGRVAVAEAPAGVVKPVQYLPRADVPVELRGAGRSSRQVHNFGTPQALDADRFIVCEVITPAENWSSYPPHKHDTDVPGEESRLEEIYYFESAVSRGLTAPEVADPFGYMRAYSSDAGAIDTLAEVRTGDIGLVPHGWHGPCAAAPGYDLYYLNVMAGPDPERVWNISDDPAHGWIRETWAGQEFDQRLPYERSESATGAPR